MSAATAWEDHRVIQENIGALRHAVRKWPRSKRRRLERAITLAAQGHDSQRRASGEPYVCHPLAVARIVAECGGKDDAVIAAVLHDLVEDTSVTLETIREEFGEDVSHLVDGCTKVGDVRVTSPDSLEAARMRKLLVAVARDPRVIAVKVADRLHNMRTIAALPEEKARRIGLETLALHGPLAGRLGLTELKAELEDLAFAAAYPENHAQVKMTLDDPALSEKLDSLVAHLHGHLKARHMNARVSGRIKMPWSAYKKAQKLSVDVEDLHDLIGLRVIVNSETDCYAALGHVHALWPPAEGRVKDYIARPKFNHYQSLHTSVVSPSGSLIEVQIRTSDMHAEAEHGSAAHRSYKNSDPDEPAWLRRLLDNVGEEDGDYVKSVARELGTDDEVLVITPKGDTRILPAGSSVLDFAYAIHTDIGDSCRGAEVNGQAVPLDTRLQSGDRVLVIAGRSEAPPESWLEACVTRKARTALRSHRRRDMRKQHARAGEAILAAALEGAPAHVTDMSGGRHQAVFARLGRGEIDLPDALRELGIADKTAKEQVLYTGRTLIELVAEDRGGLLADVAGAIAQASGNIVFAATTSLGDGMCREIFEVEHPHEARDSIMDAMQNVAGVSKVRAI